MKFVAAMRWHIEQKFNNFWHIQSAFFIMSFFPCVFARLESNFATNTDNFDNLRVKCNSQIKSLI